MTGEQTKKCPYCAEDIKVEAIKCKHCGGELTKKGKAKKPKKKTSCLTMLIFIFFIAPIIIMAIMSSIPSNEPKVITKTRDINNVKLKDGERLTQLGYEKLKVVENYYFLIETNDLSEENLELISKKIKGVMCSMDCNISLYDEKKAYDLDTEYNKLANQGKFQEAENHKKQNEKYLEEHLVGFYDFDNLFWYYMYKVGK